MKIQARGALLAKEKGTFAAALFAISIGTCVLISRAGKVTLISNSPLTAIAMNPLTALCFIASGASLLSLLLAKSKALRSFGIALATSVFIVGLQKCCAFFGWESGLDQILFREQLVASSTPNRMAPNTALNFVFLGLSLWTAFLQQARSGLLRDALAIPPLLNAIAVAVGYCYSNFALTRFGSFIPMAFHTALTFLVLCAGIFMIHSPSGLIKVFRLKTAGAMVGRRLIPYVTITPLMLGWIVLQAERGGFWTVEFGISILAVSGIFVGAMVLWVGTKGVNDLERELDDETHAESERKLGRLKRFFPPMIAEKIASGAIEDPFKWHRNDVTVIFIDMRGFTNFAEQAEPELVMHTLQEYYSTIAKIVCKHNGSIGHLAGDGVMVFFNDPHPIDAPQKKAVQMTLEVREVLNSLRDQWQSNELSLNFGAGIASGFTTIGGIGTEGFWDYTIIGTTTNVAARLCGAAQEGQILVSRRFLGAVEDSIDAERVGSLTLKGLNVPVEAFNITGERPA